jgi:hypothetical protein
MPSSRVGLLVGDRVRVSVQLVGARSDQTIWAPAGIATWSMC